MPKPPLCSHQLVNAKMFYVLKKKRKKFPIIFDFSDSQPSILNPLDADIPVRTNTSHHSCLISLI